VKFTGLYGTVGFTTIQDFSFSGESDLWSDVWPPIDGVVSLSFLLGGGSTVVKNFTKWCYNVSKIGTRYMYATHLR